MPNDNGYVLDFESVQRIGRMLRNYERGVTKPGMSGADGLQLEEGTTYVEVTGAATAAGYYPGCEKFWDLEANAWHYAPTPCVVWEINGAALGQGKVYKATLITNFVQGGVQKNVFTVQASGGGSGLSTGLVEIGNQTAPNSQLYNGWICSHGNGEPGTSWVRGDDVYIWNNSSKTNLYPGSRVVAADVGTYNGKRAYATSSGTLNDVAVVADVQCDFGTINIQKRTIVTKG